MALLSHFWELEDQPSIRYHCHHPSDGCCILGMVISGGGGVQWVLYSSFQITCLTSQYYIGYTAINRSILGVGAPTKYQTHCQEASDGYCILRMMKFGEVGGVLYILLQMKH